MPERTVAVASRFGLHARPATLFAQAVTASGAAVTIARPGATPVDASSILSVMSMGVKAGEEVVLATEDDAVLDQLVAMLATDLFAK